MNRIDTHDRDQMGGDKKKRAKMSREYMSDMSKYKEDLKDMETHRRDFGIAYYNSIVHINRVNDKSHMKEKVMYIDASKQINHKFPMSVDILRMIPRESTIKFLGRLTNLRYAVLSAYIMGININNSDAFMSFMMELLTISHPPVTVDRYMKKETKKYLSKARMQIPYGKYKKYDKKYVTLVKMLG